MTGIAVIIGLFLFFKIVSGLSEPQAEVEAKAEEVSKVEAISVKPEAVEIELSSPAETNENLDEAVTKKP
jgi:histone acetyltransferase (RNA polymerase elongator complex component)